MKQVKLPELLAPAGSLEAFFAAMEKGADAVYAGLREFSARAKAKNFTLAQMERMTAYAHSLGRRLYVTVNTLIKENELPGLIETLSALEEMNVDGIIVQDLAVARLARLYFPSIPLHASTQMTIHNSPGVRQLEEMGFKRVVLARELHIDEIRSIVAQAKIGIECFIHGALCFSFSGQCYFSSFLGGHSGNRGRCAQPCRRQYRYRGKEGYYLSTNDFSSIDMIPQLIDAGVSSLKIEGRMKSAEYVANVVQAYRIVLDSHPDRYGEVMTEARELLKLSLGRAPTRGFLASHSPADIATPSLKGATGRFLGEIRGVNGKRISFETRERLHVGDRIRVQPKSDMAGRAFTVRDLFSGKDKVMVARERSKVSIISPFSFKTGDAVFKVSSETAFTMSESACMKRLEGMKRGRIPCDLNLSMEGERLRITGAAAGVTVSESFPLEALQQARSSDMEEVLRGQFLRTGETPFELRSLSAPGFPQVLIPAARLKEVRREFYRTAAEEINRVSSAERKKRVEAALLSIRREKTAKTSHGTAELSVRIEHLRDFHLIHREEVDSISIPVSRANMHQLPLYARKLKGREGAVVWRLPFIIFDGEIPFYSQAIGALREYGFYCFEASNLSHFQLLRNPLRPGDEDGKGASEIKIITDYRLFSLNTEALISWRELEACAATLYIEDDAENIALLMGADLPIARRILVYGPVAAITSKIAIKGIRSDSPLISDRGEAYRVTVRDGLTTVTPEKRFSIMHHRMRLREMGFVSFVIDLTATPRDDWKEIIEAFKRGKEIPGASEFNFSMGLV